MGPGPMTPPREAALLSLVRYSGCANVHITRENLHNWIHPNFPLHAAFPYLSAVHQCDYLRCYTLHVHGGGYADVKHTSKDWTPFFKLLDESPAYGLGYTEVGAHGVAKVGGSLEVEMQENYQKLIGVCALIFRRRSLFTTEWFEILNNLLDQKLKSVMSNPARHPQDRLNAEFIDGSVSRYPFVWTEVGGDLFHPLVYKHSSHLIHADIAPSFDGYR